MAARLLITGASGLLGRHVTPRAATFEVVTLEHAHDDLLEPGVPTAMVRRVRPDAVLHLAWCASGTPGYRDSDANDRWVGASLELAEACSTAGAAFVGVGTVVDSAPGGDAYARAKADLRVRLAADIDRGAVGWLRPFYVVDPVLGRPGVVAEALAALREDRPARLVAPEATHDLVLVEDVAAAALAVVGMALDGAAGAVDAGSGRRRSVAALVERLGASWCRIPARDADAPTHDTSVADLGPLSSVGWEPTATRRFFADD